MASKIEMAGQVQHLHEMWKIENSNPLHVAETLMQGACAAAVTMGIDKETFMQIIGASFDEADRTFGALLRMTGKLPPR